MSIALALACVVAVHDGDTVRLCSGEQVRISNIDAPEMRGSARCDPRGLRRGRNPSWCDYRRAVAAREALRGFLANGPVTIRRLGLDHYGRTLARLSVGGRDAGAYLVRLGLARTWR